MEGCVGQEGLRSFCCVQSEFCEGEDEGKEIEIMLQGESSELLVEMEINA